MISVATIGLPILILGPIYISKPTLDFAFPLEQLQCDLDVGEGITTKPLTWSDHFLVQMLQWIATQRFCGTYLNNRPQESNGSR